jgi:hypothetical protein
LRASVCARSFLKGSTPLLPGNCAINSWDTHNLWPHVRDPDSDAEEYATLHSDAQKLLGTTYNFPQNADCLSSPKGTPPKAVVSERWCCVSLCTRCNPNDAMACQDYRANNWGYQCFSNGKCALFQTGKAEEGKYDEQLDDGKEADGIARDDGFWVTQPSNTVAARRR